TPSYTVFLLQPEVVGRLGNRRAITPAELRRSAGQIAEKHKDWRIGFMQQIEDTPEAIGLLVRTEKHRPLSLRRLLIRGSFRDYPSPLAFTVGNTLDQKLLVRDLDHVPHILLIGEGSARQHLISSMLLTLTLLNTPGEFRILLAGSGSETYQELAKLPHALSNRVTGGEELISTLTGLMAEAQSRLDHFYEEGVNLLQAYNNRLRDQGKAGLPHILVALDALTDESLQPFGEQLTPIIHDLLVNGAQVGIHLALAVNQTSEIPASINGLINTQIIMRSASPELGDKVKNWHGSLLRFIDAFVVERDGQDITPVELCAVTPSEIKSTVDYWQSVVAQRRPEDQNDAITGRTRGTGLLTSTPPGAINLPNLLQRCSMLAAYLGWLSIGALRDIFAMSETEAQGIIEQLQTAGVIEPGNAPMLRFIRLADRPE
ncbi:MAG TPA: FtsK/SpoIIIE domain-containing protein, partial [Phototrophicaceae bacterium]|nr:FtsK/SpoIIIE domain-containing protein [Phototrophicaceae bacterium]